LFENIASIDIGTSSIKVITVRTGLKDFRIKNFIYEDIYKDIQATQDYTDNPDNALKAALARIFEENNLKDYKILTAHPMQKTVIRNLTFPFRDSDKIAEVLPFEAEENIPFALEDVVLDFQMIESFPKQEGKDDESAKVLVAAARKEAINQQMDLLRNFGISPAAMGLESQALFEIYRYFNKIENESIIQLDIGNEKTIVNIIHNNNLLFTRSIPTGMESIYKAVIEKYNLSHSDVVSVFEDFNLDLTSFENNLQKEIPIEKIKKNTLKGIYNISLDFFNDLIEQIVLTKMAFLNEYNGITFGRVLISGGGSNVAGIGSIISGELGLPVISLPFLEEYTETKIRSQFPIAFGMILSYLNKRFTPVSFLKGEFLPKSAGSSLKQYYLAGAFVVLAMFILLINITATSYFKSESKEKYTAVLNERFKKYFHARKTTDDPVSEAMKMLKEEKKEFEAIDLLVRSSDKIMDILNDILAFFPKDESFELSNLVLNESVIRVDGKIGSSIKIDEFKNKLLESKKFDNVTLSTNIKKGNEVNFNMTIKLKVPEKKTE
jgi:type IV pilus assembly protein PilM